MKLRLMICTYGIVCSKAILAQEEREHKAKSLLQLSKVKVWNNFDTIDLSIVK